MRIILFFIGVISSLNALAQVGKSTVGRSEMLIGEQNQLTIHLNKGYDSTKIQIPKALKALRMSPNNPQDSVQLEVMNTTFDAEALKISITAWDTGVLVIPPFAVIQDSSVVSDAMMFRVIYPQVDDAEEIKDIVEAEFDEELFGDKAMFWDWLNWLFSALCFVTGLWLISKVNQTEEEKKIAPVLIPADQLALQKIEALYAKKLYLSDSQKMHFADFSDILRLYIASVYEVETLEKTTEQLLTALRKKSIPEMERNLVYELLSVADMIKFSKATALEDEVLRLRELAESYISKTAPRIHEKPIEKKGDAHDG